MTSFVKRLGISSAVVKLRSATPSTLPQTPNPISVTVIGFLYHLVYNSCRRERLSREFFTDQYEKGNCGLSARPSARFRHGRGSRPSDAPILEKGLSRHIAFGSNGGDGSQSPESLRGLWQ